MPHPLGYSNPIRTYLYRGAIERCQGTNQSGTRCGHRPKWARAGVVLCGQHVMSRPPVHPEATEVIEEEYRLSPQSLPHDPIDPALCWPGCDHPDHYR